MWLSWLISDSQRSDSRAFAENDSNSRVNSSAALSVYPAAQQDLGSVFSAIQFASDWNAENSNQRGENSRAHLRR
jgi:hypothetical protein